MSYRSILVITILVFTTNVCSAQQRQISANFGTIDKISTSGIARAAHSATRLSDETVLIAGGMQKDGVLNDDAELFDPKTNSFTKLANKLTKKRVSHTATLLVDGRVLIVGGWSRGNSPENSAEIFDPASQKFVAVGNTKFPRSGHSATLLESGKVLIAGGSNGERNLKRSRAF